MKASTIILKCGHCTDKIGSLDIDVLLNGKSHAQIRMHIC
jgi:hypothetical protein